MRRNVRRVLSLTGLLVIATPSPAFAQTARAGERARAAFSRGVAALDEGRYRDAVDAFEESRSLRPVPVVEYDLGLAYRGVGRSLDAIAAFERYLTNPDPHATPADLQAVRTAIGELRQSLARVVVHVDASSAVVRVDGRTVSLEADTLTTDPGPHVIEVSADGFTSERREVRLAGGSRTTIDVHLRPAGGPAHLIVSASVPDAVITVDGNRQPTSPIDLELPPGPHTVVIRASGYAEFERRVTLGATGAVHLDARLSRASHTGLAVGLGVAAGVAVIGGIVTTVILLQRPRQGDLGTLPPTTLPTIYE